MTFGSSTGSGQASIGIDMNAGADAQGSHRHRPDQGRRVSVQEEQDRLDQGDGTAHRARRRRGLRGRDSRRCTARKEIIVATGSAPRSVPGIEIDRKRIITSDEAIHLREVPKSIVDHGQRRGRRRVRVDLPPLRQRGDDRRAAAAPGAGRGRSGVRRAREVVPASRASPATPARRSPRRDGRRRRRRRRCAARPTAIDRDAARRLPARGHRPRAGDDRPRTPKASVWRWRRATSRSTRCTGRTCRASRPSATCITLGAPGHPQLAHVSSAEGIIAAERIAGQETRPLNYDHVPGCTYCDPEIGSVGPDRGAKRRSAATTCASARSRSACSAAPRWRAKPTAS